MNSGKRPTLDRLRGRSVAELSARGAQMLSVLAERVGAGDTREPATDELYTALGPEARARHASFGPWLRAFRNRGGDEFFSGADQLSETARLARDVDPEGVARLIRQADRALEGRLTLLGHDDVDVGLQIDWHRDPLRQVSAPRDHWSRIQYLDPRVAGDHKVTWEINRHQWLVTLAQAWVYTRDDRYVSAIAGALASWMDANPPKRGMNWASSLEVSLRAISWLWVFRLVGSHALLSDALIARAIGHLRIAARHITRHLSTYFSANTHLTGEALGLYYLGSELTGFDEAAPWRETGRAILREQLPIHVRSDGTYFEQSTWYHRYTLDFYLHFCILEERAGRTDTGDLRRALERLARVLMWVMRPDGSMPLIGDDDGGRLLFLDARAANDARPAIANISGLLGNETLASAGRPSAEIVWLLGREGVDQFASLRPQTPRATSLHFNEGGLLVLRDGWGPEASVMTVDAGVHGVMNAGHAHADALSFDLTIRGQAVFVDPGTCDYTTDPATRDRFRHTASHNALTVNGEPSSVMAGPFAWHEMASSSLGAFASAPGADYVDATHDGYAQRQARARYHRQIVFLRHGLWIIRDSVRAEHPCHVEMHLQCTAGLEAEAGDRQVRITAGGRPVAGVHMPDEGTRLRVEPGAVAPLYGVHQSAPHLVFSRSPARWHIMHTVIAAADLLLKSVQVRQEGEASVLDIIREEEVDIVGFGAMSPMLHGDVLVEADMWWTRRAASGRLIQWMAAGCRQLDVAGERLASLDSGSDVWGRVGGDAATVEAD